MRHTPPLCRLTEQFIAAMSTLADFSSPRLIIPELRHQDPSGAVAELCTSFQRGGWAPDSLRLHQAVLDRESLSSTAQASGWAVPHARLAGPGRMALALGRSSEPVIWFGAVHAVRLIFLVAVPETAAAEYLTVVAGLARLSQDRARFGQLLEAPDAEAMLAVLARIELRPGRFRRARTAPSSPALTA